MVRLHQFGTFGGKKRGVLWVYPDSSSSMNSSSSSSNITANNDNSNEEKEPLIELQARLQEQFPMCTDQRKVDGVFRPHMTLSHFVNLQAAQEAQQQVEAWWTTKTASSDTPLTNNDNGNDNNQQQPSSAALLEFWVDRIYLLHRKGDNGQFCIVAEIPLGQSSQPETNDLTTTTAALQVYHPPRPLESMPETEWDWVRQARLELKSRRNNPRRNSQAHRGGKAIRGGGGQQQQRSRQSSRSPDSPEVIAAKRSA
jgi:hypothetical protein